VTAENLFPAAKPSPKEALMLLADVVDRATFIGEELNDTEVAYAQIHDLYWTVLIAIANGQCEGGSPAEFAAAVIDLEASAAETFGDIETGAELRERIAGKVPEWLEAKYAPPPPVTNEAPKKKPKPRAKKPPHEKRN